MFLVVDLPAFPLQAIQRLEVPAEAEDNPASPPAGPAAVTEAQGRQSRVVAANASARAGGVKLGQTLAQARARVGTLRFHSRRPEREAAAMDLLFALAYSHTPYLERTAPGLLTLELRGLRDGHPEHLARALLGELQAHRFAPRLGLGPTPDLALFTARATTEAEPLRITRETAGKAPTPPASEPDPSPPAEAGSGQPAPPASCNRPPASFHALPLETAAPSPPLLAILHQWGLQTLGDLVALPRAEVSRRLGNEAESLWEQASGQRRRVLERAAPPRVFRVYHELEYTVHTLEPLLFLLRRLLEQLTAQLRAAGRCAGALELELTLDHAPSHVRTFQLPAPSARPELLFRVLHLHLEQVRTTEALAGLALAATPVDPPHRQQGLFDAQLRDPWQLLETQTQLVGLVGHDRVGCPEELDTHRPDAFALRALPAEVPPFDAAGEEALARRPPGPPLRRLRPPEPVHIWTREGHPVRLEHPHWRDAVAHAHGPYAASGEWWEQGLFWARQEWDVTLASGTQLRLTQEAGQWLLEGLYD